MVDDSMIVTHSDPVWRERTNFIVRLDLTPHDAPGRWEQCWMHTEDQRSFEMCCIPFFTYGISLGDVLEVDRESGAHRVTVKSGHRTIRIAFTDDAAAHQEHNRLHEAIAGEHGCLIEYRGMHYAAVDIADGAQEAGVIGALTPLFDGGKLLWEWADPVQDP